MNIIDTIAKEQQKTDVTKFKVGDGVRVHTRVREGDKERIQIFTGIVIGRKGTGLNQLHRPPHLLRRRCGARVPGPLAAHREDGSGKTGPRPPREAELPAQPQGQGSDRGPRVSWRRDFADSERRGNLICGSRWQIEFAADALRISPREKALVARHRPHRRDR